MRSQMILGNAGLEENATTSFECEDALFYIKKC